MNKIKISSLFEVHNAKSKGFEHYSPGNLPFISNGIANNGVVGFVEPLNNDKLFQELAICVSAFCEATVQTPPFLPRGNGGSGLKVLIPKEEMEYEELLGYASLINVNLRWRYSYGRMVSRERLEEEQIYQLDDIKYNTSPKFKKIFNAITPIPRSNLHDPIFKFTPITELFDLKHGDFHSLEALARGEYPTVSRIDSNNGIVGSFEKPDEAEVYKPPLITVSTVTGDSFVQLDNFLATDNVVICLPKNHHETETLFYISLMINKEKWRWMYGRQCYKTKFATTKIFLPYKQDGSTIDEDYIHSVVKSSWGWNLIYKYIKSTN